LALRANAFAVPAVRLQRERAHAVVDSGVYAVVRHPFYAADPLIFVGLGPVAGLLHSRPSPPPSRSRSWWRAPP
jgi:protein-S-isoprenylcysteine O-methyltransferase Ste14